MAEDTRWMMTELPDGARLIRRPRVLEMTGLAGGALDDLVAMRAFPAPVPIGRPGGRSVAWVDAEVKAWIESRMRARNERLLTAANNQAA
jgi:prophage regulatory protein